MKRQSTRLRLSAVFALTAFAALLPGAVQAQIPMVSIDFNDVLPGSAINTQYQVSQGVTFVAVPNNPFTNVVIADNPGLPAGPTQADNVLIGLNSAVQLFLDPSRYSVGLNVFEFDVVADPIAFPQANANVLFFDQAGNTVGTLTIDQTVGGTYRFSGTPNFQSVLLPGDADYDNIAMTPEPGMTALLGAMAVCAAGFGRKRFRK